MKKILLTITIIGGVIHMLCAQQAGMRQQTSATGTAPGDGSIGIDMPNMLPPSPSVSEITKYALVGPSLSTGAVNTHIDLYTYSTKNLHLPITLNYSSTGLKVDQIASRVGLGWMLNAGGVISRTVVGGPDESGSFAFPPADFPGTRGSALADYVNSVVNNGYDTQPDIFNYSFPGYSGRFVFKGSTISKLEQNNLIIQGNAVSGFTIITPDGVTYEFHAVETSSSLDSANPKYRTTIRNAWYLTQITHPEGDIIYLKYESCQFSYVPSVNQSINFLDSDADDPNERAPCDNSPTLTQNSVTLMNKGLFISEISSNSRLGGVLQFSYIPRQDMPGDVALRLIKLFDGTGSKTGDATIISDVAKKTVEMDYNCVNCTGTTPSVTGRLFLTEVDIDDQAYLFNYKDLDHIPARLSSGQDDFGYYNGKGGNSTLIPNRVDPRYTSGADRHPNWFYAQNGLLNKVTYPTGGYDSLEYEPNQVYSDSGPDCDNPDQVFQVEANGTSTLKHYNIYYSELMHVTCDQQTTINVSCIPMHRSSEGLPTYPQYEYGVFAGLADLNHNLITAQPVPAAVDHTTNADFHVPPGDYYLYVKVQGDTRGIATLDYNNSNAAKGNKDVAGVRIKRVLSYDQVGDRLAIKRYIYDTVGTDGVTRSSGALLDLPPKYAHAYKSFKKVPTDGPATPWCSLKTCFYTQLSSANYYETNGTGNHITYSKVTESIGDNYEGGGNGAHFLCRRRRDIWYFNGKSNTYCSPVEP
ncbi:hypothetical protein SNE25_02120 [Mucilaginibacter sabulilitoris]|uniref:Uncharacterized protein n=1 Tax=Mucilaginibacter sabulilitoris TaxID=1173583 RepID=A0ABZ0TML6_9SPHI|nr:hypothetical protein [Mucilaginibacter sabulilitoris]WPU94318.1 hypothetical protein SNE25_02120 [Mucilaginibacter sabulilitoris]